MASVIQAGRLTALFAVLCAPATAWPGALRREANNDNTGATITIHPFSLDPSSGSQAIEILESMFTTSNIQTLTTEATFTIAATFPSPTPEPEVSTSTITVTTTTPATSTVTPSAANALSVLSAALQTYAITSTAIDTTTSTVQLTTPLSLSMTVSPPAATNPSGSSTSPSPNPSATSTVTLFPALSILSAALATYPNPSKSVIYSSGQQLTSSLFTTLTHTHTSSSLITVTSTLEKTPDVSTTTSSVETESSIAVGGPLLTTYTTLVPVQTITTEIVLLKSNASVNGTFVGGGTNIATATGTATGGVGAGTRAGPRGIMRAVFGVFAVVIMGL